MNQQYRHPALDIENGFTSWKNGVQCKVTTDMNPITGQTMQIYYNQAGRVVCVEADRKGEG